MIKFITKIIIFLFVFLFIIFSVATITSKIVTKRQFKNHETEGNLLVIQENRRYNFMFMGISHARNFSNFKNHLRVEGILDKSFINIGKGRGTCGAKEQLFYLNYFYTKKNSTNTIVYILSPPLLYSETLPIAPHTFEDEPFEYDFFFNYLTFDTENKPARLISYLRSKMQAKWLFYKPDTCSSRKDSLLELNMKKVEEGFELTYKNGLNEEMYKNNCETIEQTIKLGLKNNSKIILLIPPALFGKWLGHNETVKFADKMQSKYNVGFYDYSETVLKPEYYSDHHHLNTKGIIFFTKNYLQPIL